MSLESILKKIKDDIYPIKVAGMANVSKAYLLSGIFLCSKKNSILVITYNDLQARMLYKDFQELVGEDVLYFPAKEIILYDITARSHDITSQRLDVIRQLIKNDKPKIVVTTLEAVMQKMPPVEFLHDSMFTLKVGDTIEQDEIIRRLMNSGYERSDMVEGSGQFSVRGGIIDFCEPEQKTAYRVEFFGDEIDSIRIFDTSTQRTAEMVDSIEVFPSSEWIINLDDVENIKSNIYSDFENGKNGVTKKLIDEVDYIFDTKNFKNLDKFFNYFYKYYSTIKDFFIDDGIICLDEPLRAREVSGTTYNEFLNVYTGLLDKGQVFKNTSDILMEPASVIEDLNQDRLITLSTLETADTDINYKTRDIADIIDMNSLIEHVKEFVKKGYKILIYAGNKNIAQNLKKVFLDDEIDCSNIKFFDGLLSGSFEVIDENTIVISDKKIFGDARRKQHVTHKKTKIDFNDLNIGDYVVHRYHGIGRYVGINTLNIEGVIRDYIKIEYKDNSMLYVPTSQLDLVEKYIGSEGREPKLSKMGGSEWNKTKSKVKSALKDIANELIEVYSKRQMSKGYAFSPDTVWQKDFESKFPYNETEDQLRCIDEVKTDMESQKVMDRLLCGDVGFGKTEVALRAAFKAVMDGKQVAYLVPTTVLANQHYNTFVDRMRGFPIKIEMLSRFRTPTIRNKIIKDLKTGVVDVVIGTHSIIQKNVEFNNLGLLIIDEEQKFGVTHKEKLKQMFPDVDVLTLTATPIPRTLHMSMVNIRDMSVIYDPPENRHPIQTKVLEYDKNIVREAIMKEMARGGQVYYVHNRVMSLDRIATEVQNLVPEARILVGHGQMETRELEDVMLKFIEGKADVLVCTTIIESGVDIPNANTMIVDDADKLGLAQLYQLKGRIGRSNRIANAYLMYRKDKVLSEIAEKRLKTISDFTEFGSGFKIAMRDLQIRGAGNLLGAQQHGHMEAVGYDTYCRLLDEAVKELRGETVEEFTDIQIDIIASAYINSDYIENELQRIEFYKKIAGCETDDDILQVKDELIDRFGDIPKEVENLFTVTKIKMLARENGIISIKEDRDSLHIGMDPKKLNIERLMKLGSMYKGKILFSNGKMPFITYKTYEKKESLLKDVKKLLQNFSEI